MYRLAAMLFIRLAPARNDFLYSSFELGPLHHNAMSTLHALYADVDARPHHQPLLTTARVRLAEAHHIP